MIKMFLLHKIKREEKRKEEEEEEKRKKINKLNECFFSIPIMLKDMDSLVYTLEEIKENLKHLNTKYIYKKTSLSVSDMDYAFKTFILFLRSLRELDIDLLIRAIKTLPHYYYSEEEESPAPHYHYSEEEESPANILSKENYAYAESKGALFIPFISSGIRGSEDELKKIKSFYDLYMLIDLFSFINESDTTVSEVLKEQAKAIRYIVEIYIDIYKTHIEKNIKDNEMWGDNE